MDFNFVKDNEIAELLSAISQPNRIRILKLFKKEKILCACEILDILDLEQSNLSRHLATLVKAGVLEAWKDGVRMNYKVYDERIFDILNIAENILNKRISKQLTIALESE